MNEEDLAGRRRGHPHRARAWCVRAMGRHRSDQPCAEHPHCRTHAGADQQPDPPAPERGADADQPGPEPHRPELQCTGRVARRAVGHEPAHPAGPGAGFQRLADGGGLPPHLSRLVHGRDLGHADGARCAHALAQFPGSAAHRHPGAVAGGAELRRRRAHADRPGQSQPVGRGRVAGDAGDEPAARAAVAPSDAGPAAPDHAGPCGCAGAGAPGRCAGARARGAPSFPGRRHTVHARRRQLLRQLNATNPDPQPVRVGTCRLREEARAHRVRRIAGGQSTAVEGTARSLQGRPRQGRRCAVQRGGRGHAAAFSRAGPVTLRRRSGEAAGTAGRRVGASCQFGAQGLNERRWRH
uniref:TrbJ n=1 Tax=Pseudomonas putida TaxID=303 RepID=A0A0S2PI94_PSEPU|nr:TrbJ [Pseudomonas putida]